MYFKYGTYQHPDNTVDLTTLTSRRMYSPRNRMAFDRWTLHCQGHFVADGQAAVKTTLAAFEAAYADDFRDVGLYHDDGTVSAHWLSNSRSINGVRITSRTYPSVQAEYATGRSFSLTFQADYLNVEDQIWSFRENLQFFGGTGPSWNLVPVFDGPPVLVINSTQTVQKIIQSGMVIGLEAPPMYPAPLLGEIYEHNDLRMYNPGSAQKVGRFSNLMFPSRYRYVFSSATPHKFYPNPDYPGR